MSHNRSSLLNLKLLLLLELGLDLDLVNLRYLGPKITSLRLLSLDIADIAVDLIVAPVHTLRQRNFLILSKIELFEFYFLQTRTDNSFGRVEWGTRRIKIEGLQLSILELRSQAT